MKDIFDYVGQCSAICITTNGYTNSKGRNIMGAGVALAAKLKYRDIDLKLGKLISKYGNITQFILSDSGTYIVAFPTKGYGEIMTPETKLVDHLRGRYRLGDFVPGYALKSDLELIKKSAKGLVALADLHGWNKIIMTRPGCGHGGLNWENQVKPLLDKILDERMEIIS